MGFHNFVNTAQFSYTARDFKKQGDRYCLAPIGSREWTEWWDEEEKRCAEGYTVGGLWIPGRYYHYLNFTPIMKVDDAVAMAMYRDGRSKKDGKLSRVVSDRIMGFPRFYEVDYEWYNFKHIAWNGGEFMGIKSPGAKHVCCGKTRGAGFSYKEAQDGVYNFTFIDGSKNYYFAGLEQYLIVDGILNKVQPMLDFTNDNCIEWKKNRQKKSTLLHQKASYVDALGVERGSFSEIIGLSIDDPEKAHPHSANIITPDGPRKWKDIEPGDQVFGSDGQIINVEDTFEQGIKDIYTVTFDDGRTVQCTYDHLWTVSYWESWGGTLREHTMTTADIHKRMGYAAYPTNKIKIKINGCTDYPYQDVPIESYTMGLMLGDGSIGKSTKNRAELTMMYEDVDSISHLVPYEMNKANWGTGIRNTIDLPNAKALFQELDLFDKRSGTKFIPDVYKYNSKEIRLAVINGLLDTDGSVTRDFGVIEYCTKSQRLAEDFIWVIHSLGFGGSVKARTIKGTVYYRCYVYCKPDETSLFCLARKRNKILFKKWNKKALNKSSFVQFQSIEFSHQEHAKCIRVDAEDHLYLIEDHIVTHNTRGKRGRKIVFEEAGSFKNLKKALNVCRGSIQDGDITVGQISVFGTGGEEGVSIEGLEDIFYDPDSFDMLAFPNVWEKGYEGTTCGYFVPVWRTKSSFMDEEGNVDIVGAIESEKIIRRQKKKAKDPKVLDGHKAEYPFKPGEMFKRLSKNMFDIAEVEAQIRRVETQQTIQGMLRYGKLVRDETHGVILVPQAKDIAKPVDYYPHSSKDDLEGCVTIAARPYKDIKSQTPAGMYQIVVDPYYKEESEDLTSLFSVSVWKQYNMIDPTDEGLPIAWYDARPQQLETAYKNLFMLADMYNASIQSEIAGGGQGIVDYARRTKQLHKLDFEPEMFSTKEYASAAQQKNRSIFMNMPTEKKRMGLTYLANWHTNMRGSTPEGKSILNIHRVYWLGLLKEMKRYNPDKNADRISGSILAMFMLKENAYKEEQRTSTETEFYSKPLFGGSQAVQEGTTSFY